MKNRWGLLLLVLTLSACKDAVPPRQSFYYWKTVFQLRPSEQKTLTASKINRLYIRYFDVVQNAGGLRPDATVIFKDRIPTGMETVPVVFIVNRALGELPADSMNMLAERICSRIEHINRVHHITDVPEIQMDCDWNAATREQYFSLLKSMHERLHRTGKQLSVTLRLHQLKYRKRTGIPPVDKVILMCYNMGHLTEYGNRNSILSADEVRNYLQGLSLYPLPVDIALPLFSWGVCFGNRQYRGLINGLRRDDMQSACFSEIVPDLYRVDSAVILHGTYLRKNDHIRLEEPSAEEMEQVIHMVASQVKPHEFVVWYHLDSLLLQKHPDHELQKMVDLFR